MAYVHAQQRSRRQPWHNRFRNDLGIIYALNPAWPLDFVSGEAAVRVAAAAAFNSGVSGASAHTEGVNGKVTLRANSAFLPTQEITIIMHRQKIGASTDAGEFGLASTAGGERCGGHVPFTDGSVYWDYGGSTAGTTRVSVAGLTIGNDVWAFTTGPRGMEIWQNGLVRAQNAANPTRSASTVAFQLARHGETDGLTAQTANIYCFVVSKRQLPGTFLARITNSPAEMWAGLMVPQQRRIYVNAAAGAGTFQPAWAAGCNQILSGGYAS